MVFKNNSKVIRIISLTNTKYALTKSEYYTELVELESSSVISC